MSDLDLTPGQRIRRLVGNIVGCPAWDSCVLPEFGQVVVDDLQALKDFYGLPGFLDGAPGALSTRQQMKAFEEVTSDSRTATIGEVYERVLNGTFYDDYDWASGPGLRALRDAAAAEESMMRDRSKIAESASHVQTEAGESATEAAKPQTSIVTCPVCRGWDRLRADCTTCDATGRVVR